MKKLIGIYCIENIVNGKKYVGQSVEINTRWNRHRNELNKGKHQNKHLQRSWDKHNEKNFKFHILELCCRLELDKREMYWISEYKSNDYNFGYNQDSGGQKGNKINKDLIKRMRDSRVYYVGLRNPLSSLNRDDVIKVKKLFVEGNTILKISKLLNVSSVTVNSVIRGSKYFDVVTEYDDTINDILNKRDNIIKQIKNHYCNTDKNMNDVCDKFNINRSYLIKILKGEISPHICGDINEKLLNKYYKEIEYNKNNYVYNIRKLTIEDIKHIKKQLATSDATNIGLALEYNINVSVISNIKLLKAYTDIAEEYNFMLRNKFKFTSNRRLTLNEVENIKYELANTNVKTKDICLKYNVDSSVVSNIKLLKSYKDVVSELNLILEKKFLENELIVNIKKDISKNILTNSRLADKYNVSVNLIGSIRRLEVYNNVASEYNEVIRSNIKIGDVWDSYYTEDGTFLSNIEVVENIKKELTESNVTIKDIAIKYKRSRGFVTDISKLRKYNDVAKQYNKSLARKYSKDRKFKLTNDDVIEIKNILANTSTNNREVAKMFKVDASVVSRIKNLKAYQDIGSEFNVLLSTKRKERRILNDN